MPLPTDPPPAVDPRPWEGQPSAQPRSMNEMLIRIDERTNVLLSEIRVLKETTVTRAEFGPVKAVVYGLVALLLTSVVIALVSLTLKG